MINFSDLNSELLVDVADVLFKGITASEAILALTPEDVGA